MNNFPLVSIIMPVRNGIPFLVECISSILFQSYTNWELVVVDDHSQDHTAIYLHQVSLKDQRVKVFSNPGMGIIDALKHGYACCEGDFITRMDADDRMHGDKILSMVTQLQNCGNGHLALGLVKYFSETKLGDGYQRYENWLNNLTLKGNNFTEIYKECVVPSPCWMASRVDFEKCGGFSGSQYPEDYDLCFRFYQYGMKCIPADTVLHYWRDHPDRASRNDPNYLDNRFLALKIHYFILLDYKPEKKLILWGAGNKGKYVARILIDMNIDFIWMTNNKKKIGCNIYGKILLDDYDVKLEKNTQILIAIASPADQKELLCRMTFEKKGKEAFFLC